MAHQQQGQVGNIPPPPPPLLPDSVNEEGLIDSNWFKVVITKCPTGGHDGTASISLDRRHGLWTVLPEMFYESALIASSQVPIRELVLKHHKLNRLPSVNSPHSVSPVADSLVFLDISNNQFNVFCDQLCSLCQLQQINAMGNCLFSISMEITRLTKLQKLLLQENKFGIFPQPLCYLTNLRHLNLESNQISEIPEDISKLQNLTELYLKSNRLISLPSSINELSNLEVLHLADNKLQCLPSNMCLVKLKQLHLAQNLLQELPPSLGLCSMLQGLTVSSNPLLFPPPSVCRKGVESIIKYLQGNPSSSPDYAVPGELSIPQ